MFLSFQLALSNERSELFFAGVIQYPTVLLGHENIPHNNGRNRRRDAFGNQSVGVHPLPSATEKHISICHFIRRFAAVNLRINWHRLLGHQTDCGGTTHGETASFSTLNTSFISSPSPEASSLSWNWLFFYCISASF